MRMVQVSQVNTYHSNIDQELTFDEDREFIIPEVSLIDKESTTPETRLGLLYKAYEIVVDRTLDMMQGGRVT